MAFVCGRLSGGAPISLEEDDDVSNGGPCRYFREGESVRKSVVNNKQIWGSLKMANLAFRMTQIS